MRLLCTLCLLAASSAAADNKMPREGSGWEGFKVGTFVKTKQTYLKTGQTPTITLTTQSLKKVSPTTLTLAHVTKTPLGMDDQKAEQVVPRKGEAAAGEKASPATEKAVSMEACQRQFRCTMRTVTVTGPRGKRVITNWEGLDPKLRVKRQEIHYDAKGNITERFTMLLVGLDEKTWVGAEKLSCLKYRLRRTGGPIEQRGEALLSREVPGGTVRMELELVEKGKGVKSATWSSEVLEFVAK